MERVFLYFIFAAFPFAWAEVAEFGAGADESRIEEGIDWNSDLCDTQKRFLELQIKSRVTIDQLASVIAKKSPKVVLVGEEHKERTPEFHQYFLKKLKKEMPALNCVAFETSLATVKNSGGVRPSWQKVAAQARKAHIQVHLVDEYLDEHAEADKPNSLVGFAGGFNERSRRMTGHLQKLLQLGKCNKIMMINGSGHLMKNPADQRPGIPERLRAVGVTSFNILAVDLSNADSTRRRNSNDTWLWPKGPPPGDNWGNPKAFEAMCRDVPGRIGENYAILNAGQPLAKRVPVAHINSPEKGTAGSISQFDAVLMLQCPDSPETKCMQSK